MDAALNGQLPFRPQFSGKVKTFTQQIYRV